MTTRRLSHRQIGAKLRRGRYLSNWGETVVLVAIYAIIVVWIVLEAKQ